MWLQNSQTFLVPHSHTRFMYELYALSQYVANMRQFSGSARSHLPPLYLQTKAIHSSNEREKLKCYAGSKGGPKVTVPVVNRGTKKKHQGCS